MADIEFVEGEFGDNYDITIKDAAGADADISTFTNATLEIKTTDNLTEKLAPTAVSIISPKVRWTMASGQTNYFGDYIAQVDLTAAGKDKKTKIMTVQVTPKT